MFHFTEDMAEKWLESLKQVCTYRKNTKELFNLAEKGKTSSSNCKLKLDKLTFQHDIRLCLCESNYVLEHIDLISEDNEKMPLKRYLARRPGWLLRKVDQSQ